MLLNTTRGKHGGGAANWRRSSGSTASAERALDGFIVNGFFFPLFYTSVEICRSTESNILLRFKRHNAMGEAKSIRAALLTGHKYWLRPDGWPNINALRWERICSSPRLGARTSCEGLNIEAARRVQGSPALTRI